MESKHTSSLGLANMSVSRVTCPGCGTVLQLPAGFTAGKIKCPKCAKVLALKSPSPTPTSGPNAPLPSSPQASQPDGASPFDSLPSFGSPVSSGQAGIGLPAAQPPAQLSSLASPSPPAYRQPQAGHMVNGPKQKKKKTSKGSPLKIVLIVGGIIGGIGILGCAGLVGLAVIAARSQSGWQSISQQGVTVQFPAGRVTEKSNNNSASSGKSFRVGNPETGSVFGLQIIDMRVPPPPGLSLEEVMQLGGTKFSKTRPVSRDGKLGFHATVTSSSFTGIPPGSETEMFRRGNTIIILDYVPFSKQTAGATDAKPPRDNEREIDKPNEFFESLQFS